MPFRDVVGQRRLIDLLSRSIAQESLPPSLLFSGPVGAGKRLTALAVAQALNCLEPRTQNPEPRTQNQEPGTRNPEPRTPITLIDSCGRCSACVRIARGIHPDVLVVEPGETGSIKIEQIRDLNERTAYRPFQGRRRVVIIVKADAPVASAQKALLKTLEEPPSSSVFILVTSMPDQLLPTVRSRLIRMAFAAGATREIDAEAREVAERVLAQAAATADAGRRIEVAKDLLTKTGAGGAADRDQLASHLRAMASLLRDVEVLSTGADAPVPAHPDAKPAFDRIVRTFHGERGVRAFAAVGRALEALDRNAGVKVVADWVVL